MTSLQNHSLQRNGKRLNICLNSDGGMEPVLNKDGCLKRTLTLEMNNPNGPKTATEYLDKRINSLPTTKIDLPKKYQLDKVISD